MIKKIILGLIVAVLAYNLITQTIGVIKSGDRLSKSAEVVYQLEIKNKLLKDKLSQIQSPQFIEESIRNKLGLAKKGETIVVIPPEKLKRVLGTSAAAELRLPNLLGWWRVFFR